MTRYIVYGYLSKFDSLSLNTGVMKPLRCKLHSGSSARIVTLINGAAYNTNATTRGPIQYPIEERLSLFIFSSDVDAVIGTIDPKIGWQGVLEVRSPGGRTRTATAVLDSIDVTDEGIMADGVTNHATVELIFQRLTAWS